MQDTLQACQIPEQYVMSLIGSIISEEEARLSREMGQSGGMHIHITHDKTYMLIPYAAFVCICLDVNSWRIQYWHLLSQLLVIRYVVVYNYIQIYTPREYASIWD